MAHPFTFIALLSLGADPFGGILVWGSAGLFAAILTAALLGIALNALHRAAGADRWLHVPDSPPADQDFRQAA